MEVTSPVVRRVVPKATRSLSRQNTSDVKLTSVVTEN